MSRVSRRFSEQSYSVEFGRYEGTRPVEEPAHELLIGRESQRAHFLNLLLTVGRKGAYLVTGHRGSGKTTFVRFCLDEYEQNIFRRYLAGNRGQTLLWDRIGHLAFGALVIVTAMVFAEGAQRMASLPELTLLDWISLVPLALLGAYPILRAKELLEFASKRYLDRSNRRWAQNFHPVLVSALLLGGALARFGILGAPELAISRVVLLAGWLFLVANFLGVGAWSSLDDPGAEDPSFDLSSFKGWSARACRTFMVIGIALMFFGPVDPRPRWTVQNWCFGLFLFGWGAARRSIDQFRLSWRLRRERDEQCQQSVAPTGEAAYAALSRSAYWYLVAALCTCGTAVAGTVLGWEAVYTASAAPFLLAFLACFVLVVAGGSLSRFYQLRHRPAVPASARSRRPTNEKVPVDRSCSLPFRLHPPSRFLLAFKALVLLVIGLQLSYPLGLVVWSQIRGWLGAIGRTRVPYPQALHAILVSLPDDSLLGLANGKRPLFTGQGHDELLWVGGAILLMVFLVCVEYEWIIRPYATLRDDEALHRSGGASRPGDGAAGRGDGEPATAARRLGAAPGPNAVASARAGLADADLVPNEGADENPYRSPRVVRLDYQLMAKKTFFWWAFESWLPILRVHVNLGSDVLEYRYVIEGMLAGLKHCYHRTFLHWSSPLVAIRRGFTVLILLLLAAVAAERWFGVAPIDITTINLRTFCEDPRTRPTTPNWLACRLGGERLVQFLQWAPLAKGTLRPGEPEPQRSLLVDKLVVVHDAGMPRLRGLRIFHLLTLLAFYFAYVRLLRVLPISPYRQTYDQISRLLDSLSSRLREETRPDHSKLTEWLLALAGRERVEQKEFAPFEARTVELMFLKILEDSQDPTVLLPFTRHGRLSPPVPEIVFIFDELDKIGGLAPTTFSAKLGGAPLPTPSAKSGQEAAGGDGEREPHDVERARARALHRLFSDLKNVLSSGRARFIFLGGRNLHDEWLADQSARRPLLTNTFDAEIYLPSLLTEEVDGRSASTTLERVRQFVEEHRDRAAELHMASQRKIFGPWLKVRWEIRLPVSFVQGQRWEWDEPPGELPVLDDRGEERPWSKEFMTAFVEFLGYRSRGNLKQLQELVAGFIEPLDRVIADPRIRRSHFNCEHVLRFRDHDRFRIQLLADIFRQIAPILEPRLSYRDDKLCHNVLYLSDYLLKFHRRAFTWSNLGRVDELVHIHRAPDLRSVLEDMVLKWSEGYLHLIDNGMYDYRFESDFARELEYLSRQSEQELAAFNFTLDESQQLKASYRARLAALQEPPALDFIIGLGELHEFDEEFEIARYHYRWAVRRLDEEFRFQVMKPDDPPASYAVLTGTDTGYEAARRVASWGIARVRLMLQIAMTYERARDLEHAQVEYRDARTLASAIMRGLLGSEEGQKVHGLRLWSEHFRARHADKAGYLWTLKHLNILFQPLFAEAWLAEKSVAGVDTGPSLIERELWNLRGVFPFEGIADFGNHSLPDSLVDVRHSNFALIFAELHDKAGNLYFFKGRQLAPAERTDENALQGTEGYLLRAQSHYATSIHEIRRFNWYRRESSKIKFNDIDSDEPWQTIRPGGWAEFVFRIGAGAFCNLAEALLARVSLERLFSAEPRMETGPVSAAGQAAGVKTGVPGAPERAAALGAVYQAIRRWLDDQQDDAEWSRALGVLFPSIGPLTTSLSEWFGKAPTATLKKGQLLRFEKIHGDDERLVTSLLFSLAGSHMLEEAGYFEGAAEECLRVVRTVLIYVWWIRMVQVLSTIEVAKGTEAGVWQATFKASLQRQPSPAIVGDLIELAVDRLEYVGILLSHSRRAGIHVHRDTQLRPPTLLTYACSLALGVLQVAPDKANPLAHLRRLVRQWSNPMGRPGDDRAWFRERLKDGLDRHSFPMFNRLVGLKILIDDALLAPDEPVAADQGSGVAEGPGDSQRQETAAHVTELIRLESLYKSPLHFTPLHCGLTLALACLRWEARIGGDEECSLSFTLETARRKLATSRQAVTLRRSYYEAISGLYYLYDDFNDRTIHFNHAVQMSGLELSSFVLACLESEGLQPEAAPPRKRWTRFDDKDDLRRFESQLIEWEEMAEVAPLWAVLNDPKMRGKRWEDKKAEFFSQGENFLEQLRQSVARLNWRPREDDKALDFGCGVGRLTRPLVGRFESVVGVDFSRAMIERAKAESADYLESPIGPTKSLAFRRHADLVPLDLPSGGFGFVLCFLVLQHQASERIVEWWVKEMLRVLKPGGMLVFQLPYATAWRQRLKVTLRCYRSLRRFGVPARWLVPWTIAPIDMLSIGVPRVRRMVKDWGGDILAVVRDTTSCGPNHPSATYYVTRPGE